MKKIMKARVPLQMILRCSGPFCEMRPGAMQYADDLTPS